ncbi:hypothetical protein RchiOBHm_Chr7g0205241 [Rosa chinensis]|uniref:Uncharacterized protein n=1 Tax=Rosa chinensis TaxID=74649 RepID=A0A2P6P8W4_ROSCH|nr:hypothetical protein RchiOBHm_Chr7g0205241 [Rosa chinensis]
MCRTGTDPLQRIGCYGCSHEVEFNILNVGSCLEVQSSLCKDGGATGQRLFSLFQRA